MFPLKSRKYDESPGILLQKQKVILSIQRAIVDKQGQSVTQF